MLAETLARDVTTYVERLLSEYDALVAGLERKLKENSLEHERKRVEAQCLASFERLKREQEELIKRRMDDIAKAEEDIARRRRKLEERSREILVENERLKRQHDEDHDRAATLSHAVIESRLAAQKAEAAQFAAEKKLSRIHHADAARLELIDDVLMMSNLLKKHGIQFQLKTKYVFDHAGSSND